jgi:hypothetical protein
MLLKYGQSICTATLITPNLVLTAAHCVQGSVAEALTFAIGMDVGNTFTVARVATIRINDRWVSLETGADLAVLTLVEAVTTVAPVQLSLAPISNRAGSEMTLVGYGSGSDGMSGSGFRRLAKVTVASVEPEWLHYRFAGQGACRGDSGGPAFMQIDGSWRQVGVTSWGQIPCVENGYYQRLDVHAAWLRSVGAVEIVEAPACSEDALCNGACPEDEDCWDILCASGSCKAPSGQCVQDSFCDERCGLSDPDCTRDPCTANDAYPDGACLGQVCPSDPDCAVRSCVSTPDGFCNAQCPQDPDCGCNAVSRVLDTRTGGCSAIDASGRICATAPIAAVTPYNRSCIYTLADGSVCSTEPLVQVAADPFSGLCVYYDRLGTNCATAPPICDPFIGCYCP